MSSAPSFTDERLNQHLGKRAIDRAALARAIADLEQYRGEPIAVIAERYWNAPKGPDQQDPALLLRYYQTSDRYLYESTYTEGYADHRRLARLVIAAARRWRLSPVLDFGGGGGGLTLALARAGLTCAYADVPGPLMDFVRWRLAHHGVRASMLDATQPLPAGGFRAILAVDVLEHVPDVAATLGRLRSALQPGGWLIGTHSFTEGDPLHVAASRKYGDLAVFDRLMQEEGFRYVGRLKPDPVSDWWGRSTGWPVTLGVRVSRKFKGGGNLLVYASSRQPTLPAPAPVLQ